MSVETRRTRKELAALAESRRVRPPRAAVLLDLSVNMLGLAGLWGMAFSLGVRGVPAIVGGMLVSCLLLLNVKLRSRGASSIMMVPEFLLLISLTVGSKGPPVSLTMALLIGVAALDIGWIVAAPHLCRAVGIHMH